MANVNGRDFDVDESVFKSWAVFDLIGVINDKAANPYERTNAMFKVVELSTGLGKDDVIEMSGGETAEVTAVFDTLTAIIQEAAPKN